MILPILESVIKKYFLPTLFSFIITGKLSSNQQSPLPNKKMLNIHYKVPATGGVESHMLIFNKIFSQHNIAHYILTSHQSCWIRSMIETENHNYGNACLLFTSNDTYPSEQEIIAACKANNITTIIANWGIPNSLIPAIAAAKQLSIKVIMVHHRFDYTFSPQDIALFNQTDGIVTVSPIVCQKLKILQQIGKITVKHIAHIPPFWDEERFLTFKPTRTKCEFFQDTYYLYFPKDLPIVVSVGNFYWCKNQQLLIDAFAELINKRHKKAHLILAGEGHDEPSLKTKVAQHKLDNYVHFIGRCIDVPEILYHSDIHVLASKSEAFGLAHLEAAIMQKPFVGATETGAECFIHDGIDGLLFINNNVQDLADKIEQLLDNKEKRLTMGKQARKNVLEHYTSEQFFNTWLTFLNGIYNDENN